MLASALAHTQHNIMIIIIVERGNPALLCIAVIIVYYYYANFIQTTNINAIGSYYMYFL